MSTLVERDSIKGWRVVCAVHGELASYSRFWDASRDATQHRESCERLEDPTNEEKPAGSGCPDARPPA